MKLVSRRILLSVLGMLGVGFLVRRLWQSSEKDALMIKKKFVLDFQWQTQEPFLFCVHHNDYYPKGNSEFGPEKSLLAGRDIGQDFSPKNGFRMYHGEDVPGFPVHPHRGFETITIVRKGYVDHADSLGAAGRYGQGDVQWMTAGSGVQHSEMFPLLNQENDNTMELFQIWLNLPRKNKMVPPHFTMFWNEKIPVLNLDNEKVKLTVIAGEYQGTKALNPPPDSWANQPGSDTAVWLIKLQPGGTFTIPATKAETGRSLYLFEGSGLTINSQVMDLQSGLNVDASQALRLHATTSNVEILMLQSKPIGEAVVQYGPFVMNSQAEIRQTMIDYEKTQFGGWNWEKHDMVHGGKIERFAKYPDGRIEKPGAS